MHSPNNGPSSSSLPATRFPLGLKIKSREKGEKSPGPGLEQPTVGNTSAVVPLEIRHLRWEHQFMLAAPTGDNVLISGVFHLSKRDGKPLSSSCDRRLSPYCLLNWEQKCTCRCLSFLHTTDLATAGNCCLWKQGRSVVKIFLLWQAPIGGSSLLWLVENTPRGS